MPPKVKVTKEDILHAAIQIVRQSGDQALNARTVAAALGFGARGSCAFLSHFLHFSDHFLASP